MRSSMILLVSALALTSCASSQQPPQPNRFAQALVAFGQGYNAGRSPSAGYQQQYLNDQQQLMNGMAIYNQVTPSSNAAFCQSTAPGSAMCW